MARRVHWSWAENLDEANAFRQEAKRLIGETLTSVSYVTIDYSSETYRQGIEGPRPVTDATELAQPQWKHETCDSVDHAVVLRTASDRTFSISWESPGHREGIGLREVEPVGSAIAPDALVATWDATNSSTWRDLAGAIVESVDLLYEPCDPKHSYPLWCPEINITIAGIHIQLQLADAEPGSGRIVPSLDNIVIVRCHN